MARISTYAKDANITNNDKLLGSNYGGTDNQGRPIFTTANFKIADLLIYFANNIEVGSGVSLASISSDVDKIKTLYAYNEDGNITGLSSASVSLITDSSVSDAYASAEFQLNVESNVFTFNPDGTIASVSEAFSNLVMSTETTTDYAEATALTTLSATVSTLDTDVNARIDDSFTAIADETSARATAITTLTATVDTLDTDVNARIDTTNTAIATETTARTEAITSLTATVDTLDTDVNARIDTTNTAIADETSARATAIETLEATVTTLDTDVNARIDTTNTAVADETTARVTADTTLQANINTVDTDVNARIDTNQTAIANETSARVTANTTLQANINTLDTNVNARIDTNANAISDESSARAALETTLTSSINQKPDIFYQDTEPDTTYALGSLWFDTDDNNKTYALVDVDGTKTWVVATDASFPAVFRQDEEPETAGVTYGSLWFKTNDSNKLYILQDVSGTATWVDTRDTGIAAAANAAAAAAAAAATNASAISDAEDAIQTNLDAIGLKPNVYRQDDAPTGTIPQLSIWYDTTDGGNIAYTWVVDEWVSVEDPRISGNVTSIANANASINTLSNDVSAVASRTDTLEGQFTFTEGAITGVADALSTSISTAASTAAGSVASDLDKLEAVFSFDSNGDVDGVEPSSTLSTAVTTLANEAITTADLASASSVEELETQFQFTDGTISGVAGSLSTAISNAQSDAESSSATKIESLASNFFTGYDSDDGTFTTISVSEAFANEIFTTTTNTDFASATSVSDLTALVGADENSGIRASITENSSVIAQLEGYAESSYNLEADANGVITGIQLKSASSGDPGGTVSAVTIKTSTFDIVDQNDVSKLSLNASGDLSVTGNLNILDSDNDTVVRVHDGGLSDAITDTNQSATFPNVNLITVDTWDSSYNVSTTGATISSIYDDDFDILYGAAQSVIFAPGSYTHSFSTNASAGDVLELSSDAYGFGRANIGIQFGNSDFSTIYYDQIFPNVNLDAGESGGIPAVPSIDISLVFAEQTTVYVRLYVRRTWKLQMGGISFTSQTMSVSSDMVFAGKKGKTEMSPDGIKIFNTDDIYFKIDRGNFTSGNPYVDIGGDVKIDGDLEITGSVNFSGDINNSDVTVNNLQNRLSEITSNTYIGSSSGTATFTVRDNLVVDGNLTVSGTTTTIEATNLAVADNMIYLNDGSTEANPDLGIAGNYNDGSYAHAGIFRDASNGYWTFYDGYTPEPDASVYINTGHASFNYATVSAGSFVVGDGTSIGFLKANGTIDTNAYASATHNHDTLYIRKDGTTGISGDLQFNDNTTLKLGTGNDMTIYHSGDHSFIRQIGTGNLYIDQARDDGNIVFRNDDGNGGLDNYIVLNGANQKVSFSKPIVATDISATSFIVDGGTASGFLKGDGSIDTNSYALSSIINLQGVTDLGATTTNNLSTGRITITDNNVPLIFNESGHTGDGQWWRQVLDAGNIRWDVSTSGDGSFTTADTILQLTASSGRVDIKTGALAMNGSTVIGNNKQISALGASFTNPVTIYDVSTSENPRLSLGRQAVESLNFDVGDVHAVMYFKQDTDSNATHTQYYTIDSDSTGDKQFIWQRRAVDGTSSVTKLILDADGLDVRDSGGILVNNTVVVDSSRNITGASGTFSSGLGVSGGVTIENADGGNVGHIQLGTVDNDAGNGYVRGNILFGRDVDQVTWDSTNEEWTYLAGGSSDFSLILHDSGGFRIFTGDGISTTTTYTNQQFRDAFQALTIGQSGDVNIFRGDLNMGGSNAISSDRIFTSNTTASNSLAKYAFAGDLGTGLGYIGANSVGLLAGGSRKFYVASTTAFFQNLTGGVDFTDTYIKLGLNDLHIDGTQVTASAADLNYAKDLRATGVTDTEFNYLDGVTANIQGQINNIDAFDYNSYNSINSTDGYVNLFEMKVPTGSPKGGSACMAFVRIRKILNNTNVLASALFNIVADDDGLITVNVTNSKSKNVDYKIVQDAANPFNYQFQVKNKVLSDDAKVEVFIFDIAKKGEVGSGNVLTSNYSTYSSTKEHDILAFDGNKIVAFDTSVTGTNTVATNLSIEGTLTVDTINLTGLSSTGGRTTQTETVLISSSGGTYPGPIEIVTLPDPGVIQARSFLKFTVFGGGEFLEKKYVCDWNDSGNEWNIYAATEESSGKYDVQYDFTNDKFDLVIVDGSTTLTYNAVTVTVDHLGTDIYYNWTYSL